MIAKALQKEEDNGGEGFFTSSDIHEDTTAICTSSKHHYINVNSEDI